MAEIIKEIQERDLPEYEAIKNKQICSDEDLHKLMKERERFETKIVQSKKFLLNYIEYIQFEKNTHKWITEKEKQCRCNLVGVKKSIIQRIIKLYRLCTQQFPAENSIWESFIKFSKKSNPGQVAGIYEKMIGYHGDKHTIWCDYALWTYESTKQLKNVNEIFFRALKRHPTSEVINLTFFDVLIQETCRITDKENPLNIAEKQLALDRATLLYRNNKSKITNVSYYIRLLEKCEEPQYVNCTVLLQKEIIDDLLKYFAGEAIVWDYLAQRELRGYNMVDLQEISSQKVAEMQDLSRDEDEKDPNLKCMVWKVRALKTRIELCFRVYEKAVDAVATKEMISYFINAMLALNQDCRMEGELKRHCLAKAFQMGHKSKLMSVEHYEACVELLLKSRGITQIETLLSQAIDVHKCVKLYELWMKAYAEVQNESKFYEIFLKANSVLGVAKCVSVWHLAIKFYKAYHEEHPKKLSEILKEATKQIYPEFGEFRAIYLEYTTMTNVSLRKTRELYDELSQFPPPCLELHKKMAEIEIKAITHSKGDVSQIRKCYEKAAHYFGKTNVEVWTDLLKFERDYGNIKSMTVIYERAKNTLNPELVDVFISEYSLFRVLM